MTTSTHSASPLIRRPLAQEHAQAWSTLIEAIAASDGDQWTPTSVELAEMLVPSSVFSPQRQTWAVWCGDAMVAYALAGVRPEPQHDGLNTVYVIGGVHPSWRGRGIGSELLKAAEERGGSLAAELVPGAPIAFNADSAGSAAASAELLRANGYAPARYWFDMAHDLSGTFTPDPRTQPFTLDLAEAARLAHNDAFSTHWGSGPSNAERWGRFMTSAALRPELSRIVVDDGEVLAYALVSSARPGKAYFDLIGVRGKAQGKGLGRAVLTSGLAAIQEAGGFTEAGLDVDADNPSGAGRLYTSAGFVNVAKKTTWQKPRPV